MRRFALFVLLCAVLAACGALDDVLSLRTRLQDDGFTNVSVFHRSHNGTVTLEITACAADPAHDDERIGKIVWDTYPEHIDKLAITLNGSKNTYAEATLRDTFGERQITEKPSDDAVPKTIVTWLVVALVAFLLLGAGAIVLVVVLMRRARHRKAQQDLQQQQPYYHQPPPSA